MSTASAPNRFWGVVAIALNSVLQPAGEICDGTDSPTLRVSPPFQIANAITLIYISVRLRFTIGLPFRTALGVVAERARLYENRSGITLPERHFYFRVLVFIFGALPTLIEALAIQGDWTSYLLVLGFFVPFVVLEAIDRLKKRPTLTVLAKAEDLDVAIFKMNAFLLASALHTLLCLQTISRALMKSMFESKSSEMSLIIAWFPALIPFFVPGISKLYKSTLMDARLLLVLSLIIVGAILLCMAILEATSMGRVWSEIGIAILAIAITITATLAHIFVYLRLTSSTLRQVFSGEESHKQKFMEQWMALWTVIYIILYYFYLYDPSGTYKPAWTEWLP